MSLSATTIERLSAIVGSRYCLTQADDLAPYLKEWRGLYHGTADLALLPGSTAEVAAIVQICAETSTNLVPQGGNTGLVGGAVAERGSVIISLSRLNRIRAIDPANFTLTAEAGMTLARVQQAAAEHGLFYPLSLASEGSCQIGGTLSTNAGGTNVLRYGNARDLALGLEVVLPNGAVLDGLSGLRKDNTGYDWKHLFVGAEGTLGIITAATLKLFPAAQDRASAFVALPDPAAAIALLGMLRAEIGEAVTTFELMSRLSLEMVLAHQPGARDPLAQPAPWYALVELSSADRHAGLSGALERSLLLAHDRGLTIDATIAQNEAQARAFHGLREAVSDAQKPEGGSIKHDVSVPISRVAEFIEQATTAVERALPGIRVVAFGHVGDGNIHFNLSQPVGADTQAYLARWPEFNRIVHDIAHALGGSFSAEHGVGKLKLDELERYTPPAELALMRTLKQALDPTGIMNPGKLLKAP
jgi:D-lactate dehydrogenase (cytochrome)